MRIAVVGLWHLGTVTAACLAEAGHEVTGIDGDAHVISGLQEGRFPVEEPGLAALTQKHIRTGKLRFSALFEAACDQVVVGIRSQHDKERLAPIWSPFTDRIEWMSVESAEMTKHALNAFLATSVAFTNEIARICEQVGADAREVERGLKSDIRIGRRAYLHPGAAFAGGTLARDLVFLRDTASTIGIDPALLDGVMRSNELHQSWLQNRFSQCIGSPEGKIVAILGLTYKPGTSTLRRSSA